MSYIEVFLGVVALVATAVWFVLRRRDNREFVEEYMRRFPGQCLVCSFHAYGIREGHVRDGTTPGEHSCPENRARWENRS